MNYTKQKQSKKFIIGHSIRTSNEEGGVIGHWEEFRQINLGEMIPNKISDDLFSVYTQYEEDETKPFTHIIGYEVSDLNDIPEGFCGIEIESGPYALFTAKGPFPESMMHAWQAIWSPEVKQKRKYNADFEIYTKDFNPEKEPEVKIYIAIKE